MSQLLNHIQERLPQEKEKLERQRAKLDRDYHTQRQALDADITALGRLDQELSQPKRRRRGRPRKNS